MEAWRRELYLQHHGILGQKWGKKNGPPYPLGASDHSAAEKEAGWRKSLDKPSKQEPQKNPLKKLISNREEKREQKRQRNAEMAKEYTDKASEQKKQLADLQVNGLNSATIRKVYGKAWDMNNVAFCLPSKLGNFYVNYLAICWSVCDSKNTTSDF